MKYTSQTSMTPSAPKLIVNLILITTIVSILAGLLEIFSKEIFHIDGPLTYLSLSLYGMAHLYLWQPLTYFFVYGIAGTGIDAYWMIGLAVNLYLIWMMGTNLYEHYGAKSFIFFYLITGIASGLLALCALYFFNDPAKITGQASIVLAMITAWAMLNPNSYIFLFFVIPIQTRWLLLTILVTITLINLSDLNFVLLTHTLSGVLIGYLYSTLVWQLKSPYQITQNLDQKLNAIGNQLFSFRKRSNRILDIRTGEPIDANERFMNQMLEKISKQGKDSLTWYEKWRMKRISNKRKKHN